ncbi:MAG: hypothetical protein GY847_03300 [Proteobacteria bacterium]|nr:hypothetical protein [Pseudomonadota bacterium]
MSQNFNDLELAILDWLKQVYGHKQLSDQIDTAKILRRDWTRVGFYVHFEVSKELEPVDLNVLGGSWPVAGPGLKSEDIDAGGDTLIWGTDGYIDCIEMYAYGDFFNEQVRMFDLLTLDQQSMNLDKSRKATGDRKRG